MLKGAKLTLRNGAPIEDLRIGGERILSQSTGEVNASDRGDLLKRIGQLLDASARGEIVQSVSAKTPDQVEAGRNLFAEAYADPTGAKWASLGSTIVASIQDRSDRQSLMRNLTVGATLRTGDIPRVELKTHIAHAIVATGPSDFGYQLLRGKIFNPPEFEIKANVRVSRIEMNQLSGDLLERAQQDAQAAIITQEDRLWKQAADRAVGKDIPVTYIDGQLTPSYLSFLRNNIDQWNIPVSTYVMAVDYWNDIIQNTEFQTALEPVSKYELIMTGRLATLLGVSIITDGFRDPTQRVLQRGELYCVAQPDYHGVHTTRGGVTSEPTTGANQGSTDKGWLLSEPFSYVLANVRSVSKAIRK